MRWLRAVAVFSAPTGTGGRVPHCLWVQSGAASARRLSTTATLSPAAPPSPLTTPLAPDGRTFHFDLRSPPPLRILFFGSDAFSLPTLQALLPSRPSVVCPANKPQGRGNSMQPPPVRKMAADSGLDCYALRPGTDFRMKGYQLPDVEGGWDVGVVVSFGYKLPERVIRAFRHGLINLHPSLLPHYRGASPIQHALWADDAVTGVSVIDLHPTAMDRGDVLLQLSEPISATDTFASLSARLAALGSKAVLHTLNNLSALRSTAVRQAGAEGTKAPKLSNEWGALDFTQPARQVYNHWRAAHGFSHAHTTWKGERLNITEMDGYDTAASSQHLQQLQPGDVRYDKGRRVLAVRCGCGGAVLVSRLHCANKRPTDAVSFANGNMNTTATRSSVRFDTPTSSADVMEWLAGLKDEQLMEVVTDRTVARH